MISVEIATIIQGSYRVKTQPNITIEIIESCDHRAREKFLSSSVHVTKDVLRNRNDYQVTQCVYNKL